MATSSLYGNSSESIGLYGIGSASGGTYFEWFIFYDSATAPATPTGGSWSFTTNTGTPPTGWLASPPPSPTNQVWVSLAIVDSRSTAALTWSTPGLMSSMGSTIANYITFVATSAPAYSSGRLWYDSTQNALSYYNDITNNTIHIGQETQLKVRNTTGATIAKGAPVYVLPTASGFGYPLVALAQADTATKANCIGLANQAIANNTDGYICINGLLTGANTGTFAVGDVLYLSPYSAGQLMNTVPPTGYAVRIGVVAFSNTPNGTIYVNESNAFVLAGNIVGTIGITNGGTGATTASGARTSLGLGTIATQDANNVAITGGSIAGITDLAIADGGTGASSAAGALANLGAVGLTDTQTLTNKTISGASNTLTNIGNGSLTNSSVNINGSAISLGGTATITAATPNNLVFGSGLSATGNFNGSVATNVTLANVGTAATYGDSGTIPVFTTNAFGQISSVSLQSVVVDSADISGTIAIAQGGTGASSAANARVNLLPSYAGNAGEVLALNAGGTDVEWRAIAGTGTVSSVAVSGGTTGLTTSGGPITAAGTITFAGTLATTNGGTNLTSFTSGGVVYASSTSALATGSALTFDGSKLTVTGTIAPAVGAISTPSIRHTTNAATGMWFPTANQLAFSANGAQNLTITPSGISVAGTVGLSIGVAGNATTTSLNWGTNGTGLYGDATTIASAISGTEVTRLTSTGLGIGTSSPNHKLVVVGANSSTTSPIIKVSSVDQSSGAVALGDGSSTQFGVGIARVNSANAFGAGGLGFYTQDSANAGGFYWYAGSGGFASQTKLATLNSEGNFGLGVVPNVWSLGKAMQIGSGKDLSLLGYGNNAYLSANAYFNGSWLYAATAAASQYLQSGGSHSWYIAPSGTAGNPITLTQAMTLDASGNLLVGTTTSDAKLRVTSTGTPVAKFTGPANASIQLLSDTVTLKVQCGGEAVFGSITNTPVAFVTNNSERVRIDTSGNLGVGTTSPATKLDVNGDITQRNGAGTTIGTISNNGGWYQLAGSTNVNGVQLWSGSATTAIRFGGGTTFTEQARFDTSGNLGIGTSSPTVKLEVAGAGKFTAGNVQIAPSTATNNAVFIATNTGGTFFAGLDSSTAASFGVGNYSAVVYNGANTPMVFFTNATERARIPAAGGFQSKTTISVGDATPSTSGAGITFPATQSASSDANTLDDYEEGTWTPSISADTVGDLTVVYSTQAGNYTKIGRLVTVNFMMTTTTFTRTTASGQLRINGLPFTANSTTTTLHYGALSGQGIVKVGYTQFVCLPIYNNTYMLIAAMGSAQNSSNVEITEMPSAGTVILRGSVSYIV